MNRSIAIVSASTGIGIRTYDSSEPRHLDRAPGVLRSLGLDRLTGGLYDRSNMAREGSRFEG